VREPTISPSRSRCRFWLNWTFDASYGQKLACRGGPGPSPIGHAELELMTAICMQIGEDRDLVDYPNPLWHPAVKGLRGSFLEYLGQHAERAAALLRLPRRISVPRSACKREHTLLVTVRRGSPGSLSEGMPYRYNLSLHASFDVDEVREYTSRIPGTLIPELLARVEGQTVTSRELLDLRQYLLLECRFLKGCDIIWAPGYLPAELGEDDDDDSATGEGMDTVASAAGGSVAGAGQSAGGRDQRRAQSKRRNPGPR
jgi:hypothetical protein